MTTIEELGRLLGLTASDMQDLKDKMEKAQGFAPVEVASRIDADNSSATKIDLIQFGSGT